MHVCAFVCGTLERHRVASLDAVRTADSQRTLRDRKVDKQNSKRQNDRPTNMQHNQTEAHNSIPRYPY